MAYPNSKTDFTTVVDATPGDADSGTHINAELLNEHGDALERIEDTIGLNTDNDLLGGYGDLAAYLAAQFATLSDLDTDFLVEHDEAGAHGGAKKLRCQVVADATARGNISSPREGDMAWQSDTDTLYVYDGAAWDAVAGGAAHAILDGDVHSDSVADGVTRGSLIYGNATPKWDELVIGAAGTYLRSDGTDVSWGVLANHDHTGDAGDGAQLSHDAALTGVSADDHHNQNHDERHILAGGDAELYVYRTLCWYLPSVSSGAQKPRLELRGAGTIIAAWAYAATAPSGGTALIDINLNGTTIWSTQGNRLTIADAANEAAKQTTFDTTAVSADDQFTVDLDQLNSADDVTVMLTVKQHLFAS